jgi:hypothetical protein
MARTTIAYFEARARVEPIRLILEELAIPYEDQKVSSETWVEIKSETPFGALPSYRCDVIEEAISDLNELVGKAPWRPNFANELGPMLVVAQRSSNLDPGALSTTATSRPLPQLLENALFQAWTNCKSDVDECA